MVLCPLLTQFFPPVTHFSLSSHCLNSPVLLVNPPSGHWMAQNTNISAWSCTCLLSDKIWMDDSRPRTSCRLLFPCYLILDLFSWPFTSLTVLYTMIVYWHRFLTWSSATTVPWSLITQAPWVLFWPFALSMVLVTSFVVGVMTSDITFFQQRCLWFTLLCIARCIHVLFV